MKYIYINDEKDRISNYFSEEFKEDLDRLSAKRIVERYGTHVLTDIIIGGRYKLLYRSIITNIREASERRKAVNSGFKFSLLGIGFDYNIENTETINMSLARENRSRELYVSFYGGMERI